MTENRLYKIRWCAAFIASSMDIGSIYRRELIQEATRTQDAVRHMLSNELQQQGTVCVAGSTALQWYLLRHGDNSSVRCCMFKPNHVRIFVFGEDGKTDTAFRTAVRTMIRNLVEYGKEVYDLQEQQNTHLLSREPAMIVDAHVEGLHAEFNYMQSPADSSAYDIAGRFDIDILKVIYDIANDEFRLEDSVARSIARRTGSARDIHCRLSVPDQSEVRSYMSTLSRIRTYSQRGFDFRRCPILICNADDAGKMRPIPSALPGHMPAVHGHRVIDTMHTALKFMLDVIPSHVLRKGTIGLAGELLLTNIISQNSYSVASRVVGPWKVALANVFVCGADGMSTEAFYQAMKVIRNRYNKSRQPFGLFTEQKSFVDGICKLTDVLWISSQYPKLELQFVQCPGVENIQALSELLPIGVKRIWYNFEEMSCELSLGVSEQLRTGTVHVEDKLIKDTHPDLTEMKEMKYLIGRLHRYHSQGFIYDKLPAMVNIRNGRDGRF